jgi:ubiquitin C-terminal hydrolase
MVFGRFPKKIKRGGSTLGKDIEEYFRNPITQDSYCEQCRRNTQMHSYSSLAEVPDCLIVSIQRLRQGPRGITKDEDLIDIGNQSLLIQCPRGAISLRLSSVLEHKGSVLSGHFVAHVAHDGTFYEVDDNKPIIRSENNITKGSLYFYTKV